MGFYADHVFPFLDEMLDTPELQGLRREALQNVEGRVLEVGFGSARNLPFYPSSVRELNAIEPAGSPNSRWGRRRISEWPGKLNLVAEPGEGLSFADGDFDTVVMSFVLCTVSDVRAVLCEIQRVLRPGGQYIFMEHVASCEPEVRALQDRAARVGIWRRLACGCELNRETEVAIVDAGFEISELKKATISPARRDPILRRIYKLSPAIYGSATRPA
jgi:ubiquinone/menaquinone biosynthesis C-methylase UbiE